MLKNLGGLAPAPFKEREIKMKYPKLLERLEKLEKETYSHDDNAKEMYDNIMRIVATARPKTQEQEETIIYDTLYLLENMHYETLIYEPLREFELNAPDSVESFLFDLAKGLGNIPQLERFPTLINDSLSVIYVGNLFRIYFEKNTLYIDNVWNATKRVVFSSQVTENNGKNVLEQGLKSIVTFLNKSEYLLN